MAKLLEVDAEGWAAQLPQMKEHYAKFGDKLPQELRAELEALEQRLDELSRRAARMLSLTLTSGAFTLGAWRSRSSPQMRRCWPCRPASSPRRGGRRRSAALKRLSGPGWALIPIASIIGVIFAIRYMSGTATGAHLAGADGGADPRRGGARLGDARLEALAGAAAVPLFVLAWASRTTLVGEGAATLLSALSCVTLGVLLATVTPPGWLKLGIIAMAAADSWLVLSDLLQAPNATLVGGLAGQRAAAASERAVRNDLDGLRRPVRRRAAGRRPGARGPAPVAGRAADARARGRIRPAVLRPQRAAGDGAGGAGADRVRGLAAPSRAARTGRARARAIATAHADQQPSASAGRRPSPPAGAIPRPAR